MSKKVYNDANAPTYEIYIGEDDSTGIRLVSLVANPAIDIQGMFFSKEEMKNYSFTNLKERQMVVGPALIPNKKIARKDDEGDLYFVYFSEDTIRLMVEKFNKENNNKSINVDHTNQMVNAYIQQNWIIEDSYYDKSKMYGYSLPKGSWFIEVKIEDQDFWNNEVKEGGRYSFSVEGLMGQKPSSYSKQKDLIDELTDDQIYELMADISAEEKFDRVKHIGTPKSNFKFAQGEDVFEYVERSGVAPVISETRSFCQRILDSDKYYTMGQIDAMSSELGYDVFSYGGHWYREPGEGGITTEECRHEWKKVSWGGAFSKLKKK